MAEGRCERPLLRFDLRRIASRVTGSGKRDGGDRNGGEQFQDAPHYAAPPLALLPFLPSTDSVILPGSLFGFSISPTTGIMIRKKAK